MKNIKQIAGVDEVGRGCLAGPVVSAAVIFKKGAKLKGIKDSKKLSFLQRKKISKEIKKNSYFSFGIASVKEIEKLNILQASLLSMKRAILKLSKKPDLILVDGKFIPKVSFLCKAIIKGDEKVKCISAASILAKVFRDDLMIKMSKKFNHYSWNKNFGYGTKEHMMAIDIFGPSVYHRLSFSPLNNGDL